MGDEYRAMVLKSGNSLAVRMSKALGLREGSEMRVREEHGSFIMEPVPMDDDRIDLTDIYGSVPGLKPVTRFELDIREFDRAKGLSKS